MSRFQVATGIGVIHLRRRGARRVGGIGDRSRRRGPRGGVQRAPCLARAGARSASIRDRRGSVRSQAPGIARRARRCDAGARRRPRSGSTAQRLERDRGDLSGGNLRVDDLVHEGGIWRRFPAAAAPDRPADRDARPPVRRSGSGSPLRASINVVQRLAHAVQALELERRRRRRRDPGHMRARRHGVGVVGGELRIDPVGHARAACAHWRDS